MRNLLFIALAIAVVTGNSACGPGWAALAISRADRAITEMEIVEAEEYAPYEYWSAKLYCEEAKYKNAYAQFQTAAEYGERAQKFAKQAKLTALEKKDLIRKPPEPEPEPEPEPVKKEGFTPNVPKGRLFGEPEEGKIPELGGGE